jgi:hypothetical protein
MLAERLHLGSLPRGKVKPIRRLWMTCGGTSSRAISP